MSPRLRARVGRLLVVLSIGTAALPALLFAHTALRRSEPPGGARLMDAPQRLVLEFTEVVALATARVTLRGPAGDTILLAALRHADSTQRVVVTQLVGPPRAGAYTVEWTVAGTDGHPVRGTFGFTIDTAATGLAAPVDSTDTSRVDAMIGRRGDREPAALDASSPVYAAVRFLGLAALLGVLGTITLGLVVVPRASLGDEARDGVMRSARRFGLASAVALLVLTLGRLVLQTVALHGSWDAAGAHHLLTGTVWGTGWQLQAAGALLAAILLGFRRRHPFGLALVPGLAIAVAASLSGHPVAVPGAAGIAVTLDAIHVLAVGGWLGSLAAIVLAVMPAGSAVPQQARVESLRRLLVTFTPVALASAATLVLSGAVGAWLQLGGIAPLFTSAYGRLLLIKIAVVAAVAGLGLVNWRRIVPGLTSARGLSRFRASAGSELTLAVIALIVTAVLMATSPPGSSAP
ncbi:MAG TPA: copper resistance protein CopC [Gemmatimonadaceae bacterium]|nr:copper resistance protein CopC [Gemmatimonadaceae bacterium]